MIISHKYKFIFIKTRKTGGTSLEIALARFCGEQDVITKIDPVDEPLREDYGARKPQNYYVPYSQYPIRAWGRLLFKRKRTTIKQHVPAPAIRRLVGEQIWTSYFKFAVERNPWDRIISLFYYQLRDEKNLPTLDEFISQGKTSLGFSNFYLYTINDRLAVDHLARYEDLDAELVRIAERIGLPDKLQLPNAKGNYRRDRRHYRDVFTPTERDMIQAICAKEIALLHYEF